MSQQWGSIHANFYLDSFGNDNISIHPVLKTQIKEEPSYERENEIHIERMYDGEELMGHKTDSAKVKNSGKTRKSKNVAPSEESRTCNDCGKVLASTSSLYVHLKSHSSEKPYICSECGANFTRKYYLEVHQRTHTGERPFKCDICEKYFSQKSSLNTHKRRHTGETPYHCSICDKGFTAQSYLASHQWTHYMKTNGVFTCSNCNLIFESRMLFAEHIRTHVKSLTFQCEYCPRKFSKESHLIRHKNGVHLGAIQND